MSVVFQRGKDILDLTEKYGISNEDIFSDGVAKDTKRSVNKEYQSLEILGYEFKQSYKITIRDMSTYQDFVSGIISLQNTTDIRAEFDISNREEMLRSLVKQASDDAKRRASDLAKGLGVKNELRHPSLSPGKPVHTSSGLL